MSAKRSNAPSRLDWEMIERDVVNTPGMTLDKAAEKYDVTYETMRSHGGSKAGNWLTEQKRNTAELVKNTDSRMVEILAQHRAGDIQAFLELEKRLQKVVLSSLELLFPPTDAPLEAHIAAANRLEEMSAKQLSEIINQSLRTLTETGRHRRLLTGQATALFGRADVPDVLIDEPIESAQALEMRSRLAQKALKATAKGSPIDTSGCTVSLVSPSDSSRPLNPGSAT
ncbi:hypothetical protein ACFLS0_01805 [Candidatus Bipolaricaulota bacterium]